MKKTYWIFGLLAGIVVVLDQVTKYMIYTGMRLHDSFPVIDGFFNITYVRNPGAAFGFLSTAHPSFRAVFFICVTVAAVVLILYYLRISRAKSLALAASLALILGGAIGNLIDRVRFGEVVDFLDVYVGAHHWPAFNVADSAITVGAVLLVLGMMKKKRDAGTP